MCLKSIEIIYRCFLILQFSVFYPANSFHCACVLSVSPFLQLQKITRNINITSTGMDSSEISEQQDFLGAGDFIRVGAIEAQSQSWRGFWWRPLRQGAEHRQRLAWWFLRSLTTAHTHRTQLRDLEKERDVVQVIQGKRCCTSYRL